MQAISKTKSLLNTTLWIMSGLGYPLVSVPRNVEDMAGFPRPRDTSSKLLGLMLLDQSEEGWRYKQPMKLQDWSYFGHDPLLILVFYFHRYFWFFALAEGRPTTKSVASETIRKIRTTYEKRWKWKWSSLRIEHGKNKILRPGKIGRKSPTPSPLENLIHPYMATHPYKIRK